MNSSCMEIKEKQKGFLAKGIMWLIFALLSLLLAFLPLISDFADKNKIAFFTVGGICFIFFAFMFVMLLIKELKPSNAVVLDSKGFKLCNQFGNDVIIDWANVESVEIFGTQKEPVLGVKLENTDMVIASLHKKAADDMRENIEENLPSILIYQNEIRMSLSELKTVFDRFIRDARVFDHVETKSRKKNPFKSEDVIRAFGGTEEDVQSICNNKNISEQADNKESAADEFYNSVMNTPSKKESEQIADDQKGKENEPEKEMQTAPSDIAENEHTQGQNNLNSENPSDSVEKTDAMPDDFKDLLSNVRSNKISEIEKILSSDEVPYSSAKVPAGVASSSSDENKEQVTSDNENSFISSQCVITTNDTDTENALKAEAKVPDKEVMEENEKTNNPENILHKETEKNNENQQNTSKAPINTSNDFEKAKDVSAAETLNEQKQDSHFDDSINVSDNAEAKPAKSTKAPAKDEDYPSIVIIDDDDDEDDTIMRNRRNTKKKSKKKTSGENPVNLFKVLDIPDDNNDN